MPSLIKQDDHYYLQFYDKIRTPKRKRVALRTTLKRDAQTKRRELEAAYIAGEFDPWHDDPFNYKRKGYEPSTIGAALEAFLEAKHRDGRSKTTLKTYGYVIGGLVKQVGAGALLDDLTRDQIEAFSKASDIAEATRGDRHRRIGAFLAWCRDRDVMRRDPMEKIEAPSETEQAPRAVTPADLREIEKTMRADYADKLAANVCREGEIVWMIPMYWFALYTGLRASELARLRWRDVDRERRQLAINVQKNKKAQTVPLHAKALDALEDVPEGAPDDFVFRNPAFTERTRSSEAFRNTISRAFTTYRKAAGLRRITLHGLRHGFATALAESGASAFVIRAAARHADVSTSQRYVSLANHALQAEMDRAFA